MKIQVLCRFTKKKKAHELSDEDRAELMANKIINSSFDDTDSLSMVEYEYDPVIFNLEDIVQFLRFDDKHTEVKTIHDYDLIVKIPFDEFKQVYMELSGNSIQEILF